MKVLKALADVQKKFSRTDLEEKSHEELKQFKKDHSIESDNSDVDDNENTDDLIVQDSDDSISDSGKLISQLQS